MARVRSDHRRIGPRRGANFYQRHQIRRIDGVRDQAALPRFQIFGECTGRNARGRGCNDCVGSSGALQFREQGLLHVRALRPVFLDVFCVAHGFPHGLHRPDARQDRGRLVGQQPGGPQLRQPVGDKSQGLRDLKRELVP